MDKIRQNRVWRQKNPLLKGAFGFFFLMDEIVQKKIPDKKPKIFNQSIK